MCAQSPGVEGRGPTLCPRGGHCLLPLVDLGLNTADSGLLTDRHTWPRQAPRQERRKGCPSHRAAASAPTRTRGHGHRLSSPPGGGRGILEPGRRSTAATGRPRGPSLGVTREPTLPSPQFRAATSASGAGAAKQPLSVLPPRVTRLGRGLARGRGRERSQHPHQAPGLHT